MSNIIYLNLPQLSEVSSELNGGSELSDFTITSDDIPLEKSNISLINDKLEMKSNLLKMKEESLNKREEMIKIKENELSGFKNQNGGNVTNNNLMSLVDYLVELIN